MMDDADRRDERIQNTIDDAIAEVRRKPSLVPCGACHWCGEAVNPNYIFCSSDCSIDYQRDQKMKQITGKKYGTA